MKIKGIILSLFITIVVGSLVIFSCTTNKTYASPSEVYEVYLNGKSIGYLDNEANFLALVNEKQKQIKDKYEVDNVYPPTGLEIKKVITYNENIKTANDIYNVIENTDPFTIDGYVVTIKYTDEEKEPLIIYTLDKEYFETAAYNTIATFVGGSALENYKNNTQEEITDIGTKINSIYWEEEITIKESHISIDKYIFTDDTSLSKYLLFGTTDSQKTYTVQEGDSIDEIIENNQMSIEEFLIANPSIVSKNVLLSKGQQVNISVISPLISVIHEVEVVEYITNKYVTEYQNDDTMYVGQTKTIQEGTNGMSKATELIKYQNGDIETLVMTKSEEVQPTINKIVAKGTKNYSGYNPGSYVYTNVGNDEWYWPTVSPYVITSRFGYRWYKHHNGIDVSGTGFGSPIYSATDGVVEDTYTSCSNQGYYGSSCGRQWGNYVRVIYGDYTVIYAHIKNDVQVKAGDTVTRGQLLGYMGNSGSSTGTHLHFGILHNPSNTYVNPCKVLGC